jgi:hypothetical protein
MAITKNQKILIGIGVVALGYYLYQRNKKKSATVTVTETTEGGEETSEFGGRRITRRPHKGGLAAKRSGAQRIGRVGGYGSTRQGVCGGKSCSGICCAGDCVTSGKTCREHWDAKRYGK